jgi:putative transposase
MKTCIVLFWHLLVTIAKLLKPGGVRVVVAENLAMKHQNMVMSRTLKRSPKLTSNDRFLLGFWTLFIPKSRIPKIAVILKPATLFRFHDACKKRKYSRLFSSKSPKKPGPKGPSQELIDAILEMEKRNPRMGTPTIAQQISIILGIEVDKDVVRRVLDLHYKPPSGGNGPSWLTFIGHIKDSLWSLDFFRCESINLVSHWVMVVMDQFTRRIIGFAVNKGDVDGPALCRMFNRAIPKKAIPNHLSTDNAPLFEYHQWNANLRILDIDSVRSVPFQPVSHPFVERLIGSVRRELLDKMFFWSATDLEKKLSIYQHYFNEHRTHAGIDGQIPAQYGENVDTAKADLSNFQWQSFCRGLFELPKIA